MICYGIAVAVLGAYAPTPLAGACLQTPHPCSPNVGSGVFHSIISGPLPRFVWCLVCGLRLFFSLRLAGSFGFVSLCYVSSVRLAFVRGFFASLAGSFWGRFSVGVGCAWLCYRTSIKSVRSSIIVAFLQINSYLCTIIKRLDYG